MYISYMEYMSKFTVEDWAKEWLKGQRDAGQKCLEIKISNGKHYVYRSTTRYDKLDKKPHKVSEYLGVLDKEEGLILRKKKNVTESRIKTIQESGPLRLLDAVSSDIRKVLAHRFQDLWERIYAMAMLMAIAPVRMKNASDKWEKYEPICGMAPAMSATSIKTMYQAIGNDRETQNLVYHDLSKDAMQIAFDLSEFFSTSGELTLAEKGRNPEFDDRNQINVALACDMETGEPMHSRALFGSIRDVKTLITAIKEMGRSDIILVADRGFYSESNLKVMSDEGMSFAIPVKRNSAYYDQVIAGEFDAFVWHERVIRFGKKPLGNGHYLYRFQNLDMSSNEEQNAMKKLMAGSLDKEKFLELKKRMGHMIIVSNLDKEPEWIYQLYKRRDSVEKDFRRFFEVLGADSFGVTDSVTAEGMLFILTLAVRIRIRVSSAIRKSGLDSKYSVEDVLTAYSKAYSVQKESGVIDYEVPAKTEKLDRELGLGIFPISRS